MKIVDMATEIWYDVGSPTSTSIPAIAYWVRAQVGKINNLLYEDFYVNNLSGTYEILDGAGIEITPNAVAIIKQLYKIYDYEVQIRSLMNALAVDSVTKWEDQGTLVVKVNKNEMAKTLANIRKDEIAALKLLVSSYRCNTSPPSQVAGDDTVIGYFTPYRTSDYDSLGVYIRP